MNYKIGDLVVIDVKPYVDTDHRFMVRVIHKIDDIIFYMDNDNEYFYYVHEFHKLISKPEYLK